MYAYIHTIYIIFSILYNIYNIYSIYYYNIYYIYCIYYIIFYILYILYFIYYIYLQEEFHSITSIEEQPEHLKSKYLGNLSPENPTLLLRPCKRPCS